MRPDDASVDDASVVMRQLIMRLLMMGIDVGKAARAAIAACWRRYQISGRRHQSLMDISTPAGILSRVNASIVLLVGSIMSSSRLCVRISKCSRESLST